eukprot:sb/3473871/
MTMNCDKLLFVTSSSLGHLDSPVSKCVNHFPILECVICIHFDHSSSKPDVVRFEWFMSHYRLFKEVHLVRNIQVYIRVMKQHRAYLQRLKRYEFLKSTSKTHISLTVGDRPYESYFITIHCNFDLCLLMIGASSWGTMKHVYRPK